MTPGLLLTLGVLVLAFVALALNVWSPDMVLLAALAVVTAGGVLELERALQGFANPVLLALGSLYVIAAALRDSGALDRAGEVLLGRKGGSTPRAFCCACAPA